MLIHIVHSKIFNAVKLVSSVKINTTIIKCDKKKNSG